MIPGWCVTEDTGSSYPFAENSRPALLVAWCGMAPPGGGETELAPGAGAELRLAWPLVKPGGGLHASIALPRRVSARRRCPGCPLPGGAPPGAARVTSPIPTRRLVRRHLDAEDTDPSGSVASALEDAHLDAGRGAEVAQVL
jgi:hypothetical protein